MEIQTDKLDVAIFSVLEGVQDPVSIMSTLAAMIFHHDDRFDWVGFYRNRGDNVLEIGPYQGPLGCLEIPFGKGVCGHVARTKSPIIVPDVEEFAGHIACSSLTRSEMVLPVNNQKGELLAVFDFDSHKIDAFTPNDVLLYSAILDKVFANVGLEEIVARTY